MLALLGCVGSVEQLDQVVLERVLPVVSPVAQARAPCLDGDHDLTGFVGVDGALEAVDADGELGGLSRLTLRAAGEPESLSRSERATDGDPLERTAVAARLVGLDGHVPEVDDH